ncbi:MAG: zeta toxin family protein [Polyangiaceae bacterium]
MRTPESEPSLATATRSLPSAGVPLVLGIAGGSGSGKTTIARSLIESLVHGQGILLEQDHYYRPQTHLPPNLRETVNYDHPDSLELDLLASHIDELRAGRSIERPIYDFAKHDRAAGGVSVEPAPIIVVEKFSSSPIRASAGDST